MNLFWFLTSIVQYNLSWDKPASIQKIKQAVEDAGPVWQKFAQTLSGQEDLIGKDLAVELQDILCNCPKHSDSYSRKVIRMDFGDKYDLSDMELIGSGTIAQVYRVGDVCIKVRHPNVAEEVMSAVESYNIIRNTIPFMPLMLKQVCDNFFAGIEEQLDFHREFYNGNTFKELLHAGTRPSHNLFVIPAMLDKSDECLVMEYEPSQPLVMRGRSKLDKHVQLKALHGIMKVIFASILHGFIHADLHFGNYGVRGDVENLQIVLYDFGHMYDVRDIPISSRIRIIRSGEVLDAILLTREIIDNPVHVDAVISLFTGVAGDKKTYNDNLRRGIQYLVMNNIPVMKSKLQSILTLEKTMSSSDLLFAVESDVECRYMIDCSTSDYYRQYFPYDDLQMLAECMKQCEQTLCTWSEN